MYFYLEATDLEGMQHLIRNEVLGKKFEILLEGETSEEITESWYYKHPLAWLHIFYRLIYHAFILFKGLKKTIVRGITKRTLRGITFQRLEQIQYVHDKFENSKRSTGFLCFSGIKMKNGSPAWNNLALLHLITYIHSKQSVHSLPC